MMKRFALALAAICAGMAGLAHAQSLVSLPVVTPATTDKVCGYATNPPNAAQCSTAQSIANLAPVQTTFPAPTSTTGSIILTPGASPTSAPANGSIWVTSAGVFAEVNGSVASLGVTVPTAAAGGSNTQIQFNSSGLLDGVPGFTWSGTLLTLPSAALSAPAAHSVILGEGASALTGIGPATTGLCLVSNGATADPSFQSCPAGSSSGASGAVQYSGGSGAFASDASHLSYNGTTHTLALPDGSAWSPNGLTTNGANLNLQGGQLLSGTALLVWAPSCPITGGTGATWLIGTTTNFCSHVVTGATDNISMGTITFDALTSGFGNLAFGSETLKSLTTGSYNACFGFEACHLVTTGQDNVALGPALSFETTGSDNVAIGPTALNNQAGASFNVGVGAGAGQNVTTGANNTLIGTSAGAFTTGGNNMVLTNNVGPVGITTGTGNVYIGGRSASGGIGEVFPAATSDTLTIADGDSLGVFLAAGWNPNSGAASAGIFYVGATGGMFLTTAAPEGSGTINIPGAYYDGGTVGVTCTGTPTSSFASKGGIVTHC